MCFLKLGRFNQMIGNDLIYLQTNSNVKQNRISVELE